MTAYVEVYTQLECGRGSRPFRKRTFCDVKKITSEIVDGKGKIIKGIGIVYGMNERNFFGVAEGMIKSFEVKL